MENQLKGKNIIRASKSFLVSVDAIEQLTNTEAVMSDGSKIPVGRQYYPVLKDEMTKKGVAL
jgi:DNA-binding LytR/AlgR family response regulator